MTYEICAAIRHVELEPEVFTVRDSLPVVSLIYAYLRMGIPVILGVEIEGVGGHAITLTGLPDTRYQDSARGHKR